MSTSGQKRTWCGTSALTRKRTLIRRHFRLVPNAKLRGRDNGAVCFKSMITMLFAVCAARENNDGSLCRACQVHRSRRQKRQRFPEASRSFQANGEDFWSDRQKHI